MAEAKASDGTLKRDLGSLESYAVLVGILVGAGIFKVTSDASAATGPSVILGHLVLAPVIMATAVAYIVFLSTSLGLEPGGEVLHISSTFKSDRLTFVAAWLKLISYLGAGAYLADALALNLMELFNPDGVFSPFTAKLVGLGTLALFFIIQFIGARFFGRVQVVMCGILALALAVLLVPGLFAIDVENYKPFFTGGASGFGRALPSMFFAYAGFEALSQAAGEVKESRKNLPRVFVRGIVVTALIFLAMSFVAFGTLPSSELSGSGVPMSAAAATYLPFGAEALVTLGAIMAIATSLNASMFVPSRLACYMARDGLMPPIFAELHTTSSTPTAGLCVSFSVTAVLMLSGRFDLALNVAVVSLMLLYALHSLALLLLPKRNPAIYAEVESRVPRRIQLFAACTSILALVTLVLLTFKDDVGKILSSDWSARLRELDFTSLELLFCWGIVGLLLYQWNAALRRRAN